ncbi:MAG: mannose-1-phosphate guanylyltransferase [Muribaculaceae bacterium]|nr:mannose-1-phosphate guanylyltransferase [Muribaculaceae bacterium]
MCGGVGSRFWPFSRSEKPKQFLDFFGSGTTLLQATYERVKPVVSPERIVVVTNKEYAGLVKEQLPEIKEENILLEPARRNTAPCICWAAHHILERDPEASIVTLPSDQLVLKEAAFHKALEKGLEFVEGGDRLLTLGIRPTSPHTGYGYIQRGEPSGTDEILKVKSFTEKPTADVAELFLNSGEFFWNAGIFLWTARNILKAFDKCAPQVATVFADGDYTAAGERGFIEKAFPMSPSISIDYAVMEKADNVYVETVDLGWSDLGSWKALFDISPKGAEGNVSQNCRLLSTDCRGTLFAVQGDKIIVADGLKDYIVADSEKALLIYPIAKEQDLRHVVNEVKNRFGEEFV